MWQLFIEPNDVLLFRDGKPFAAGEDHLARSLFPPTPFTMQGVVRSRVLFDSGVSPADYASTTPSADARRLHQQIGTPSGNYGQLRLRGPFVARCDGNTFTRYFPLPADVIKANDDYTLVKPLADSPFTSNQPTELRSLWARTDKPLKEVRGWLAEDEFCKYLSGQTDLRITPESDLIIREPRLGIALDYARRSTEEGMLYTMEFLRLREGVGFVLEVDGIDAFKRPTGFLQVGGEARPATYKVLQTPLSPLSPPNPLPKQFKVVLLTPGWFSGGWQPQNGNWAQFFDSDRVHLVAAAMWRAQFLGGAYVDDRRREGDFQKTMHRFVPAGSVYFFECDGAVVYNNTPFTETPSGEGDFGQIGFGSVALAAWEYA